MVQKRSCHREDGPARFFYDGDEEWWLDGEWIWGFYEREKLDLTNKIIISKESHPKYSTAQVWKWLDENGVKEQIVIPGMEEFILE